MPWQNEMTIMLRMIINDFDDPQSYTDIRLQQTLVVGAQFVNSSFNFSQLFTVDVSGIDLSPDPTVSPTIDDWFSNLTVLQTAVMIVRGELKAMSVGAIMFKEGSATVDMREGVKWKAGLLKEISDQFDHAKLTYQMAIRPSCAAIIGPFNILAGNFRAPYYSRG